MRFCLIWNAQEHQYLFFSLSRSEPAGYSYRENDVGFFKNAPGNALLSQKVAQLVPSALKGLTTVFGMGTGVTLSLLNYQRLYYYKLNKKRSQKISNTPSTSLPPLLIKGE